MTVTLDLFSEIIRGAYDVYKDDDGAIRTKRFSDKQAKIIARDCEVNTHHHAGMRLDFTTDASDISMSFRYIHNNSRLFMSIDIYEDGVMTGYFKDNNCIDNRCGSFSHKFEKSGKKRVTVYLPFDVDLAFDKIELSGESHITPYNDYTGYIYVIGDSITQGYDAQFCSYSYVNTAMRSLGADYINQGVGGYVYRAASLDPELFANRKKPSAILVSYGSNDWSGKTREKFEEETVEFYQKLREYYPDIPVLSLTPIWRSDYKRKTASGDFDYIRDFITKTALSHKGISVLDGDKLTPHLSDFFLDVRLHPSDLGFTSFGIAVAQALSKVTGITPPTDALTLNK